MDVKKSVAIGMTLGPHIDVCDYCHTRPALKTNSESKFECANKAQHGYCYVPEAPPRGPIRREEPKVGRNDLCLCMSGKKYKHCHGK